jgi:hypothetical protein
VSEASAAAEVIGCTVDGAVVVLLLGSVSEGDERASADDAIPDDEEAEPDVDDERREVEENEGERACCWILSFCSFVRWRVVIRWVTMSPLNRSSTLAASCLSCRSVEDLRGSSLDMSR